MTPDGVGIGRVVGEKRTTSKSRLRPFVYDSNQLSAGTRSKEERSILRSRGGNAGCRYNNNRVAFLCFALPLAIDDSQSGTGVVRV